MKNIRPTIISKVITNIDGRMAAFIKGVAETTNNTTYTLVYISIESFNLLGVARAGMLKNRSLGFGLARSLATV
jgi:5-hydroxyisourate hydrolase-like protein (transthyretin family)